MRPLQPLLLLCGDPHGRFDHIVDLAQAHPGVPVVLLGDMEPARPLHVELKAIRDRVWWIPGNHDPESDELWVRVWGSELEDRNLHGRVVTLPTPNGAACGLRVAGLGGVFRESVWHPDTAGARRGEPAFRTREQHAKATPRQDRWGGDGPHRKHWGTIYPEEVDRLADLQADILVTHEAPGYHPHGFDVLDKLAQSLGVRVAVHGHHHDGLDSSARWEAHGFRSYGVGLRGVSALMPDDSLQVRRPGELDEQRRDR